MNIFKSIFSPISRENVSYSQVLETEPPKFTEFSVNVARQIKDVNASILLNYMAEVPNHLNQVIGEVEEWYPFYEDDIKKHTGLNLKEIKSATQKLMKLGMIELRMKRELKMKIFRLKSRQDRIQTN